MSIAIVIPNRDTTKLCGKLKDFLPEQQVEVWPTIKHPEHVEFVIAWNPPPKSLDSFINLKAIASFGAGVDSILSYEGLPQVPVSRIVDPGLAQDMARYVLSHVLAHQQRHREYLFKQDNCDWRPRRARGDNRVLILGAGHLGRACANLLAINNFTVTTWSKSKRVQEGVHHIVSQDDLEACLADTHYIVNLLPLTPYTEGILGQSLFSNCKQSPLLINVGRGAHLDEDALLEALSQELLCGAVLDVFRQEPLDKTHCFWGHSKITVTPHISAVTDVNTVVKQLVENCRRVKNGQDMLHCVNLSKGY